MKLLTAGIFAVLVGLVSADSAVAAIASQAWVEQGLENRVATEDYDKMLTALDGTLTSIDTALGQKAALSDVTGVKYTDTHYLDSVTGLKNATVALDKQVYNNTSAIATLGGGNGGEGVQALLDRIGDTEEAITTLNSGAAVTGSVANSIATALTEYTTTDDLQDNYVAKGQGTPNAIMVTDTVGNVIPVAPAECEDPESFCVLTYGKGTNGQMTYKWESIKRAFPVVE